MCKSLLKEFRFKIGEQYELNEFNLKSIESTFSNGLEYENYEYIKGDFETLFGLDLVRNVILQYNGDILYGVIYEFKTKNINSLIERINNFLSLKIAIKNTFKTDNNVVILYKGFHLEFSVIKNRNVKLYIRSI